MPASAAPPASPRPAPPKAAVLPPGTPPAVRPPAEAELVRLWRGQHLPPDALATCRGEPFDVVYRGRLSTGPGPDFRDAIIQGPGGRLWQGDVEIHVRASGFRVHRHDRDPAYDGVVLHLVWEDDEGEDTVLCSGRRAPVVALAPWFRRRSQDLARLLARPDAWREPCFTALARLGPETVGHTLDRLGDLRFRQKAERLRRALSAGGEPCPASAAVTADQVLYAAVLKALGYGGQREAFAALARELPYHRLQAGAAGLAATEAVRRLETALLDAAAPSLWQPRCRRPANHPRRRLAGAARLLARAPLGLASYASQHLPAEVTPATALRAWTVAGEDGASPALVGRGRAVELLANAVLPFLAAGGGSDSGLQQRAASIYRRLPAAGRYGAAAHLEQALGTGGGRALTGSARRQQGLLYLLRHHCRQGGCAGRCPLSEAAG